MATAMTPASRRGRFDYHFISLEPTRKCRNVTVFDREVTRTVVTHDEDKHGDVVEVSRDEVPDWKAHAVKWPVMQYVICDGEGVIVERIPIRGSRAAQAAKASSRLGAYMAMEA